jgi:sterol 24-C-methyltransferase
MEEPYCTACLVATAAVSIFAINYIFKKIASGFERDAVKNSFSNPIIGSFSLLSNNDSVLARESVDDSIKGYEKLFSGARKDIGATTSKESVKMREKEYKTMVNSFYDLVTDFYEWGWGQVRLSNRV